MVSLALLLPLLAQTKTATPAKPTPPQSDDSQLYRNSTFAFRYQIPYGWVNRTKEMEAGNDPTKSGVLLAVFQRPPQATGDSVNSAVVIAFESAASYPGLKQAEDYLGPLTELTTSKGFRLEGDPDALTIDSRDLVRADFSKSIGEKLTMRQSTLLLLVKGQILSFTFIGGSDDEVGDLIEGLHFSPARLPSR